VFDGVEVVEVVLVVEEVWIVEVVEVVVFVLEVKVNVRVVVITRGSSLIRVLFKPLASLAMYTR
jgi:hypothetical protein